MLAEGLEEDRKWKNTPSQRSSPHQGPQAREEGRQGDWGYRDPQYGKQLGDDSWPL